MSALYSLTAIATTAAAAFAAGAAFSAAVRRRSHVVGALPGIMYRFRVPNGPAPLQAFESPFGHQHRKFCVYLGGLTDGLLACKYVDSLAEKLDAAGWALVQPVLSSSYTGYGISSLDQDAKELSALLCHISASNSVDGFAIVGHSTGCQDAVTLLRGTHLPDAVRAKIRAAVLQAPVSDRESDSLLPDAPARAAELAEARRLIAAGEGHLLMTTLHNGFVPISAARYASLNGRLGPDDMFSSDLTDAELEGYLGHMSTLGQRRGVPGRAAPLASHPGLRACFCHSGADEYVPKTVDVSALSKRFVAAAGGVGSGAEAVIIDGAAHNCVDHGDEFVAVVARVLADAV